MEVMDGVQPEIAIAMGTAVVVMIVYIMYNLMKTPKPFLQQQDRKTKVAVPLVKVTQLSPDTIEMDFGLPTADTVLGLPIGNCLKFFVPNPTGEEAGKWNGQEDREDGLEIIERKYTPTSSDRMKGAFRMVIKVYEGAKIPRFPDGGKMSQYFGNMKVGDTIDVSGPWGLIEYTAPGTFVNGNKTLKKKHIGMMAGGSGITPILQAIAAVLENPSDTTTCALIYANKTEEDILCRDMLDAYAASHPDRFTVHYTLDEPPKRGWKGSKGFIDEAMISANLPGPGADTVTLMCGPPPMVKFACKANLDKLGYAKADQLMF